MVWCFPIADHPKLFLVYHSSLPTSTISIHFHLVILAFNYKLCEMFTKKVISCYHFFLTGINSCSLTNLYFFHYFKVIRQKCSFSRYQKTPKFSVLKPFPWLYWWLLQSSDSFHLLTENFTISIILHVPTKQVPVYVVTIR